MLQFRVFFRAFCAFLWLFRAFRLALFVVCNQFVPFGFNFVPFGFNNSCFGFIRAPASCPLASFVPFWLQFPAFLASISCLFGFSFVPFFGLLPPWFTLALRISCLKLVFRISLLLQPFRPVGVVLLKNRIDDYSYLLRSVLFWLLAIIAVYIIY